MASLRNRNRGLITCRLDTDFILVTTGIICSVLDLPVLSILCNLIVLTAGNQSYGCRLRGIIRNQSILPLKFKVFIRVTNTCTADCFDIISAVLFEDEIEIVKVKVRRCNDRSFMLRHFLFDHHFVMMIRFFRPGNRIASVNDIHGTANGGRIPGKIKRCISAELILRLFSVSSTFQHHKVIL